MGEREMWTTEEFGSSHEGAVGVRLQSRLDEWAREQQLRDHPDLAVLDADLDRSGYRP
ncbi:hypothetical protein OHU45_04655 [Streptomyces tubercidicus]|uniref:hypothetical protein n=1 Tax=Streptomyces tubercidicus TaxID=47759 RepID=UPI002E100BFF|nr:hypothetical protein OG761_04450 [Streptomyces tubercidicus]WSX24144.1 hypothetical protein OG690_32885 [Streptomyces tubercidicus]